jgi:hypothetical protein
VSIPLVTAFTAAARVGNQADAGCGLIELTPMTVRVSPKATRSSSRSLAVGKR